MYEEGYKEGHYVPQDASRKEVNSPNLMSGTNTNTIETNSTENNRNGTKNEGIKLKQD